MNDIKQHMQKTLDLFRSSLVGIGPQVNESLVSTIKIFCNGQQTPLQHIASIVHNKRQLSITPYDQNLMNDILKILIKNGFDAHKFSKQSIIINVPLPSGEELKKIQKHVDKIAEDARVSIRNIRRKFKTKDNEKEIQSITDFYISEIDSSAELVNKSFGI